MSDGITRPRFEDGQIATAADFNDTVGYGRDQLARHLRMAHTPGIVEGLRLVGKPERGPNGTESLQVTLEPGAAVDASGRSLVVSEAIPVNPAEYPGLAPNQVGKPEEFAVVIRSSEQGEPGQALSGRCNSATGGRIVERAILDFVRVADWPVVPPRASAPDEGPAAPDRGFAVVVGFVVAVGDRTTRRFSEIRTSSQDRPDLVCERAGLRAAKVVGPALKPPTGGDGAGREERVVASFPEADAADPPAIFQLGLHTAGDNAIPLLSLFRDGSLKVTGVVTDGAKRPDPVYLDAGTIQDGETIPLPKGVDPATLKDHRVEILLTPILNMDEAPEDGMLPIPILCKAEPGSRKVSCRVHWFKRDSGDVVKASSCRYLIVVSPGNGPGPGAHG